MTNAERQIIINLLCRLMSSSQHNPRAMEAISIAIGELEKLNHNEINAEYQKKMREERL